MKKFLFVLMAGISTLSFAQNSSIKLDGIDDVLTFPQCDALTAYSFTIEGWVKSAPSDELEVIMMAYQDNIGILSANVTLEIRNGGLLRFNYRGAASTLGGDEIYSKTVIQDGTWHHFAAVKEENQRLLLYIDGFLETVSCFNMENIWVAPNFEIGRNKYDGANQFRWLRGSVDDFKIWEKSKTAKEIYQGFRSENSGDESGLYSNYKFDIESDTVFDCSVNKRHGIRTNTSNINLPPQFSTDFPVITDVDCTQNLISGMDDHLAQQGNTPDLRVYPNPANSMLRIQFSEQIVCKIIITNPAGQVVLTDQFNEKTLGKDLDIHRLPSGNYELTVIASTFIQTKKFIKVK